jgi:hypothetical protein
LQRTMKSTVPPSRSTTTRDDPGVPRRPEKVVDARDSQRPLRQHVRQLQPYAAAFERQAERAADGLSIDDRRDFDPGVDARAAGHQLEAAETRLEIELQRRGRRDRDLLDRDLYSIRGPFCYYKNCDWGLANVAVGHIADQTRLQEGGTRCV